MTRAPAHAQVGYFGKLPACADFVKEVQDLAALDLLDEWLANVMRQLPASARWKIHYDAMAPVSFAFLGAARHHALAGHLVASHDLSGRRFPFLLMCSLEVADPAGFVAAAPLACAALWDYSAVAAQQLLASPDPATLLHAIPAAQVPLDGAAAADAFASFMESATIGALDGLLRQSHGTVDCARLILALGLLLQPVMHSRSADLRKSLVLPLPRDPAQCHRVAAFWLALTAPFLRPAAVDLAIFFTQSEDGPVLVLAACAAAAETLGAIIDPLVAAEQQIHFSDTRWVDDQLRQDVDVRKLASYLAGPRLTLGAARELFLQTFIGGVP